MTRATFFGEVAELTSRAVWYDDEDDDDNRTPLLDHQVLRSKVQVEYKPTHANEMYSIAYSLVSLLTRQQLNSFKPREDEKMHEVGSFDSYGRLFMGKLNETESSVILLLDSACPAMRDHHIAYLVESLIFTLKTQFKMKNGAPIILLDELFNVSGHLEYLASPNGDHPTVSGKQLFHGNPLTAPQLVRNPFIATFFEQLILTKTNAFVVRLPDPRDVWFDRTKDWPTLPESLLGFKLSDSNLGKTLLFT